MAESIAARLARAAAPRWGALLVACTLAASVGGAFACAEISTDPRHVASIAMDTLPFPSIVANDSLRDSLGVARPLRGAVYNIEGAQLQGFPIRFSSPDSGVTVDSVSGFVVADTARATPVRLIVASGSLQAAPDTIYVVPSPDTAAAASTTDSLLYSLVDTTANLSNSFGFTLEHRVPVSTLLPVRSYLVSYRITYPSDTALVQLMSRDGGRRSSIDTTASDGSSARRIRLRPLSLTSPVDSVIIIATARYHGVAVPGTPLRFVLQVKPHP